MQESLYFKLCTIPQTEDVQGRELELYYEKYRESNKLESLQDAREDYYKAGGKNPLFGKIHSLTVGYITSTGIRITVLKGDEVNIIQEFINICSMDYFKSYQVTSWNFSFVLPFLRIRATKNGIFVGNLHKDTQDLGRKPWTMSGLCLADYLKGVGWFQSSLEEMAELTFNLKTDFVDGADVYNTFKSDPLKLDKSSANEMLTMINVHRIIKGGQPIEEYNVDTKELVDVKEVEQPILLKLHKAENLTQDVKARIEELLAKNKLTKKEKVILEDILVNVYINNEMFKTDTDLIKEIKKQEIKDLVNAKN